MLRQWRSLLLGAFFVLPMMQLSAERGRPYWPDQGVYHDIDRQENIERRQMNEFYDEEADWADDAGDTGLQSYEGDESPYYSDDPGQAEADSIFQSYDPDNR